MAFPVILVAEVALKAIDHLLDKRKAGSGSASVKKQIEEAVKADPTLVNEMNAEKPYQSRVVVGSSGALLPAVGYLIWAFSSNGMDLAAYDPSSTFLAVMTVGGAGYALLGRLWPGLKPLFSRGG